MDLGIYYLERPRTHHVECGLRIYDCNNYFEGVVMKNVKDLRAEGYVTEEEIPKFTLDLPPNYKFNEDKLIAEFARYIDSTYNQHYAKEKFQATEFIIDGGHGTGFCIGNVLKYAQRYGKKGTRDDARKDLLKVLHYALIQLHVHDSD
jgi:hypothetical protein